MHCTPLAAISVFDQLILLIDEFQTEAYVDDVHVLVDIFTANRQLEYEMYRKQEDDSRFLLVVLLVVFNFVVSDEQLHLIRSLDQYRLNRTQCPFFVTFVQKV